MTDREQIIAALKSRTRSSLEPLGEKPADYVVTAESLRQAFERNLQTLGGKVVTADELTALGLHIHDASGCAPPGARRWIDPNATDLAGAETNVESIWKAHVGIAFAKGAIAQTGTLIFESGPDSDRLTTLIPPVSVVYLRESTIVPTLTEAVELVARSDRTCVFVSGPSRTADIEGVLVRGVHGPGELYVVLT